MKQLLIAINAHIQSLHLTERLIVLSDGQYFILYYQSPFAPVHAIEETAKFYYQNTTTIEELTSWVDVIIKKPRD